MAELDNKTIIAIISSLLDDIISNQDNKDILRGPRGFRGPQGYAGKDFSLDENKEEVSQIVESYINSITDQLKLKFDDLSEREIERLRGPRGQKGKRGDKGDQGSQGLPGIKGKDGKDFSFEESQEDISNLVNSYIDSISDQLKLKFDDLSDEERLSLQGPKGLKGKDGKDFSFEESQEDISNLVNSYIDSISDQLKLKFDDLSDEERLSLQGPKGLKGRDGKDFSFEESQEDISNLVNSYIDSISEKLKLKFEDLSDEERVSLQGPKGLKGRDGKDFSFEESQDDISNLVNSYIDSITDQLKLKFEDLTETDLLAIKGPRGQKGKRGDKGDQGDQGIQGPQGLRGIPGVQGVQGIQGPQGRDGRNGYDAPIVTDVELVQSFDKKEMYFVFEFSDGTEIVTNDVTLPEIKERIGYMSGGGGGGPSTGISKISIYNNGVLVSETTNIDFVGDNIHSTYNESTNSVEVSVDCLKVFDEGDPVSDCVKSINFVGAAVEVVSETKMSDWDNLEDVDSIGLYEKVPPGSIEVRVANPSKFSLFKTASESISKFDLVRLVTQTNVAKANVDSYGEATVMGVALNNALATEPVEVLVFGVLEDPAFNFPINLPLFLGSSSEITQTAISTVGKFLTKVGKSYGTGAIFIDITDPKGVL